jgi:hypothetical protein
MTFFGVCDNSLPSVGWLLGGFLFPPFDPPHPPYFGGSHLTHFFIFFNIKLFVGVQIVGPQFFFGHEIQRNTLQNFANL